MPPPSIAPVRSGHPTVTVTVAESVSPAVSVIVYWNVSIPLNPASGVYSQEVCEVQSAVPLGGSVEATTVIVSPLSVSGSTSLARTSTSLHP